MSQRLIDFDIQAAIQNARNIALIDVYVVSLLIFFPTASNSSTYLRNAMEVRDEDGNSVLTLCAKTAADKEKWLKCVVKERDVVKQDKENG